MPALAYSRAQMLARYPRESYAEFVLPGGAAVGREFGAFTVPEGGLRLSALTADGADAPAGGALTLALLVDGELSGKTVTIAESEYDAATDFLESLLALAEGAELSVRVTAANGAAFVQVRATFLPPAGE